MEATIARACGLFMVGLTIGLIGFQASINASWRRRPQAESKMVGAAASTCQVMSPEHALEPSDRIPSFICSQLKS